MRSGGLRTSWRKRGATAAARRASIWHTKRRAMTLVELLIALVIMAILSGAVSAMIFATSRATEDRTDVRHAVVQAHQVEARLADKLRAAAAFLAQDATHLVYWRGDTNEDDVVNLAELGMIEYVAGTTTLNLYEVVWPTGWSQDQINTANVTLTSSSNFLQAVATAQAGGYFPAQTINPHVSSATITLNNVDPQLARLVTLRLVLKVGDVSHPLNVVGSLRAPVTVPGG
jgi:prepilin-type N-terminal cleavage/methylation domain-containing protein